MSGVLALMGGGIALALVVDPTSFFELEGDMLDNTALSPPDWTGLFDVVGAPNGTVTGPKDPLPGGGILAQFGKDELAIAGLDRTDCSVFAKGNKNGDLIADWEFKSGSTPPKDDLSNVMAFLTEDGSGNRILYLGLERYAENGDSHIDFEINQGEVGLEVDTPEVDCPGQGHFTGERQMNDLLVVVDFERGGDVGLVRIYRYLNAQDLELVLEQAVDAPGVFCNTANGLPDNTICVANNDETLVDAAPWANFNRKNKKGPVLDLPRNAFTEIGIVLGNLPGNLSTDHCITSINVKTRSSQSITSELKDFVLLRFDTCSDINGHKFRVEDDGTCETIVEDLAGWEIRLLDADGILVTVDGNGGPLENPTCTDGNGFYEFLNIPNGEDYTVCEIVPDRQSGENFNWVPCLPADGTVGAPVSPGSCPAGGGDEFCYNPFTLEGDVENIDFHNLKEIITCDLTTVKFCDENGDGTRQPAEAPEEGFCLCIEPLDGSPIPSTTVCGITGPAGDFSIPVATDFTYGISEDLTGAACAVDGMAGWIETTPTPQVVFVPPAAGQPGEPPCPSADVGNTSVPTIECGTDDLTLTADEGLCTAHACFIPTAQNECGEVTIDCTATGPGGPVTLVPGDEPGELCGDFPAACPAVTTVTCTATTEATDNIPAATDECSFTVTVSDDEDPVLHDVPEDLTVQCNEDVPTPAAVTCSDNCDGDIDPVFEESDDGLTCPKTITRTWTCTDTCLNSVTETQTIVVNDITDPVLHDVPADVTVECDEDVPLPAAVTCTDNCDGDIDPVYDESDDGLTCPRTITRTWTCTDACENTVTETQTIIVDDITDPVLHDVPGDVTVECNEDVPLPATVTCTDNCDGDIDPVYDESDDGLTCPKTITRTWTCTDACENTVTETQTIIVNDITDPVLHDVPADVTVECDEDVPAQAAVTCTDNCGDIDPVYDESDDGLTCPKTITRTWTCTDACENTVTETQTIIVDDTMLPTVTCPLDQELTCGIEFCFTPTAEDNCDPNPAIACEVTAVSDPDRIEFDAERFCVTLTASASATIECTATDDCNNASEPCPFDVSATCNQACSPGYWRNHNDSWCLTEYQPVAGHCPSPTPTEPTLFVDAFMIDCPAECTNVDIPASFDPDTLTLLEAVDDSGGAFNQALFHGSAALLSSYAVSFPVDADAVRTVMKAAFAGNITFSEAHNTFATWNKAEDEGGCPLD